MQLSFSFLRLNFHIWYILKISAKIFSISNCLFVRHVLILQIQKNQHKKRTHNIYYRKRQHSCHSATIWLLNIGGNIVNEPRPKQQPKRRTHTHSPQETTTLGIGPGMIRCKLVETLGAGRCSQEWLIKMKIAPDMSPVGTLIVHRAHNVTWRALILDRKFAVCVCVFPHVLPWKSLTDSLDCRCVCVCLYVMDRWQP